MITHIATKIIATILRIFYVNSGHLLQTKAEVTEYPGAQSVHMIPLYPSAHFPYGEYSF